MNQGKYVFAQIVEFLPRRAFDTCVTHYRGNNYVRHFTCWHQLLCMMFGQLCNRESLSDLILCIQAHQSKAYHLGLSSGISKNNLAKVNQRRDYRIYAEYAYVLIGIARKLSISAEDFDSDIESNVYAFDATIIDLCISVFWWARFRKTKGGIKMHTLFDIKTNIPCFIHITEAAIHEVNAMDEIIYEKDSFYVFDRGYIDFARLYLLHKAGAYFVVRAKINFRFHRIYSRKCDKSKGVRCDQTIMLSGFYTKRDYPEKLRRVKYYDEESDICFVFLTNNFELSAFQIASLYKYRWKIELFFKWIKQHLKIKTFWGTSENAVRTQIYIAIITFVLITIVKCKIKSDLTNYEILQILSMSILDKTPVNELFLKPNLQYVKELNCNQLKLF
jgi:Domain of unknown function (DUF4372)/Transposase DDE domain